MARETLSAQALLDELVQTQPYNDFGQRRIADYLVEYCERHGLADAKAYDFPSEAEACNDRQFVTPCNVMIEVGEKDASETIVFHAHFDTVKPTDYPEDFKRRPSEVTIDNDDPDICYGLGTYDMLGSIVAYIQALENLPLAKHRRLVFFVVWGEENQSEGTHALIHPNADPAIKEVLEAASGFVSLEIPVAAKINDEPHMLIGRPGRVGLELTVRGDQIHSGSVTHDNASDIAFWRSHTIAGIMRNLRFEEHPDDPLGYMPKSILVPSRTSSKDPQGLSVSGEMTTTYDLLYSNPYLTPSELQHIIREALREELQPNDDHYRLTLQERAGGLPFTRPWLESPNHPYVLKMLHVAREAYGRKIRLAAGSGTADEPILAHHTGEPCIVMSTQGQGEHTRDECVRLSSIKELADFIQGVAKYEGTFFSNKPGSPSA